MMIHGVFVKFLVQSFDISTAVDPSHVISLIRKLLPSDGEHAIGNGLIREEPRTGGTTEDATHLPENGGEAEAMESSENHDKLDGQEPANAYKNEGGSVGEQTWEECGCILWDLAASEDHAQFMVLVIFIMCLSTCSNSYFFALLCHWFAYQKISAYLSTILREKVLCLEPTSPLL